MKKNKITRALLLVTAILIITSCGTSKKSSSTPSPMPSSTNNTNNQNGSEGPYIFLAPSTDIKIPENEELIALQEQYKDVTLETLKEGHVIYTESACVKCHVAQSIYKYETAQWKGIIEDMAIKANISDAEKDAVYKYVLAIKATQPK